MKKLFPILLAIFLFTGCLGLKATPTTEVENFFSKYQQLDNAVISQLDDVVNEDENLTNGQKKAYKDVIKRQYKDLTYEIKDETVDGDVATVVVEIEVYDYHKSLTSAQQYLTEHPEEFTINDAFDEKKYFNYKVDKIADTKEKIKYTINLKLTKHDDKWVLDDLSDMEREKIHGLYNYS